MGKLLTITRAGSINLIRFIIKHWYLWIVVLAILPSIMNAISIAKETHNPSYPIIALGLHLANADAMIYKDVETLRTNPAELIGMEKPTEGIWFTVKYYWKVFWNVIWKILGNIFLITVPFVFFYKIFRVRQTSEPARNFMLALIMGFLFIFVINLIIVIHSLIQGNTLVTLPEATDFFQEAWWIIKTTMPFHGLISLFRYLITLF